MVRQIYDHTDPDLADAIGRELNDFTMPPEVRCLLYAGKPDWTLLPTVQP